MEACYFDVCDGTPLVCNGRGLQAIGNYFRMGAATLAISFGSGLSTTGRDPAAVVTGSTLDLNGSTTAVALARFGGFTAASMASGGGGEYRGNLAHNHGAAMPGSWAGQFVGSDGAAVATTTSPTLDLTQGPVLAA